ncbi:MAG: hypothetical protein ACYCOR_10635 [Acidobacteriaceae bacterium]
MPRSTKEQDAINDRVLAAWAKSQGWSASGDHVEIFQRAANDGVGVQKLATLSGLPYAFVRRRAEASGVEFDTFSARAIAQEQPIATYLSRRFPILLPTEAMDAYMAEGGNRLSLATRCGVTVKIVSRYCQRIGYALRSGRRGRPIMLRSRAKMEPLKMPQVVQERRARVALLLESGCTTQEIADAIGISYSYAATLVQDARIMRGEKFQLANQIRRDSDHEGRESA